MLSSWTAASLSQRFSEWNGFGAFCQTMIIVSYVSPRTLSDDQAGDNEEHDCCATISTSSRTRQPTCVARPAAVLRVACERTDAFHARPPHFCELARVGGETFEIAYRRHIHTHLVAKSCPRLDPASNNRKESTAITASRARSIEVQELEGISRSGLPGGGCSFRSKSEASWQADRCVS